MTSSGSKINFNCESFVDEICEKLKNVDFCYDMELYFKKISFYDENKITVFINEINSNKTLNSILRKFKKDMKIKIETNYGSEQIRCNSCKEYYLNTLRALFEAIRLLSLENETPKLKQYNMVFLDIIYFIYVIDSCHTSHDISNSEGEVNMIRILCEILGTIPNIFKDYDDTYLYIDLLMIFAQTLYDYKTDRSICIDKIKPNKVNQSR